MNRSVIPVNMAKAAVYVGANRPFEIREYPVSDPERGVALLSLVASGICGTDIHIVKGRLAIEPPMILGHEFLGRVESISDEDAQKTGLKPGHIAIACVASPCGACPLCAQHDEANCVHMGVTYARDPDEKPHLFGGFADASYAPVQNLVRVPDDVNPYAAAVFACAGPTALHAFRLAKRANIALDEIGCAVVQGAGPVGAFAAMYLKAAGVQHVIVVTARENEERANRLRALGADEVVSLERVDPVALVKERTGGLGAELAFEASGKPAAFAQGLDMLRNRGIYLVPGQYSSSGTVALSPEKITFGALRILGSSQYALADIYDYLFFLESRSELQPRIAELAETFSVERINEAMAFAESGKAVKTMLVRP